MRSCVRACDVVMLLSLLSVVFLFLAAVIAFVLVHIVVHIVVHIALLGQRLCVVVTRVCLYSSPELSDKMDLLETEKETLKSLVSQYNSATEELKEQAVRSHPSLYRG